MLLFFLNQKIVSSYLCIYIWIFQLELHWDSLSGLWNNQKKTQKTKIQSHHRIFRTCMLRWTINRRHYRFVENPKKKWICWISIRHSQADTIIEKTEPNIKQASYFRCIWIFWPQWVKKKKMDTKTHTYSFEHRYWR